MGDETTLALGIDEYETDTLVDGWARRTERGNALAIERGAREIGERADRRANRLRRVMGEPASRRDRVKERFERFDRRGDSDRRNAHGCAIGRTKSSGLLGE